MVKLKPVAFFVKPRLVREAALTENENADAGSVLGSKDPISDDNGLVGCGGDELDTGGEDLNAFTGESGSQMVSTSSCRANA
jgi:hypothetical protein